MANAAYQGVRSRDPEAFSNWVFELEFQVLGIPLPDLFFIFDIPVSLSQKNVAKKAFAAMWATKPSVYEKDLAFFRARAKLLFDMRKDFSKQPRDSVL